MIKDDKTKALFYKSCAMIMVSKGLAIASPWFLKSVVDTMALSVAPVTSPPPLPSACGDVGPS